MKYIDVPYLSENVLIFWWWIFVAQFTAISKQFLSFSQASISCNYASIHITIYKIAHVITLCNLSARVLITIKYKQFAKIITTT